ncbi:hypothetical protein GCM10009416_01720 [Craurococcus roseus]|uniref:Tetratricopeptide repeat protein n=1 Tax=Craurococcus roseus TaxID=77585 RepID=A0ABN1EIT2_9PROT
MQTPAVAIAGKQPASAAPASQAGGVVLDFPRGTGAALVKRGGTVLAVFDSPELRNPDALRHPAIAGVQEAGTSPQGLVLAFPVDRARPLRLARGPSGWVLAAAPPRPPGSGDEGAAPDVAALGTTAGQAPSIAIAGVPPNRVVVLRDPETGLPLLIGTTREAGRGFAGGRRAPEYDLLETGLGVAVLARSGSLRLQALPDRFVLSGSVLSPLSLDAAAAGPAEGAAMSRCLDLPDLRPEQLLERLRAQSALLAGTEPLARAGRRRDLAATMLALGLGHEAQAEMNRAAFEDADAAAGLRGKALAAAAALVAVRLDEAAAFFRSEPAPGCDELVLWRSLFLARTGDAAAASPGLRATLPLLRAYPAGLRNRLLPVAAEALAGAGAWPALRGLLADAKAEARLSVPAAMLLEADGDEEGAIAAYDAAARGRDRRARAAALRRAVELRLSTGRVDAAEAARAYAPALVVWRGDAAEREARARLAQLLALSRDAGGALALLRQSMALFPDGAAEARRDAGRVLRSALDGGGSPVAAVAAFQAGSDLLSPEDREAAEARLVELLVELDLPGRVAAAVLDGAAKRAGAARAEAGWRVAALRLRENDHTGARAALDATEAPDMPDTLRERRAALAAAIADRAGGGSGGPGHSAPGTAGEGVAEAEGALGRRDWAAAARVLGRHLESRLPAAPAPLDPGQQEAVLRLASALALAGDDAAFAVLRGRVAGRMEEGPHAAAFARLVGAEARPAAESAAPVAAEASAEAPPTIAR